MKLYHFTAVPLAESILSDALRFGHVPIPEEEPLTGYTWLTTSAYPEGTGVPQETVELTEQQLAYVEFVERRKPKNTLSQDKSRVRIMIDSDDLKDYDRAKKVGLVSFLELYRWLGIPALFGKYVGLSANMNVGELTAQALQHQLSLTGNSEEHCWYLHRGAIPAQLIQEVCYLTQDGYVPYDFETHGRVDMQAAGFGCAREQINARLATVLPASNRFEAPKAFVICENPNAPIYLTVRGAGTTHSFDMETGEPVTAVDTNYPLASVQQFVIAHRDEWQVCRNAAIAGYYRFYPEQPKV
ncbi:hypothetical protein [Pseudomonas sp. CHM02]|uniref:hypothetical protein n=1 Tax=Pseudomonas sp. CHM02 TaxID=1463662 RepID=UPI000470D4A9|nr:hypothetical protein [Pseudomonas sp. CHM02]